MKNLRATALLTKSDSYKTLRQNYASYFRDPISTFANQTVPLTSNSSKLVYLYDVMPFHLSSSDEEQRDEDGQHVLKMMRDNIEFEVRDLVAYSRKVHRLQMAMQQIKDGIQTIFSKQREQMQQVYEQQGQMYEE